MLFFIAIISLVLGSFASCISYRLANDESFVFVRSKCPKCHNFLKIRNLFPLFSWIFQRGKCLYCHAKISWRYPLIEIGFLVIFLALYFENNLQIDLRFVLLCLIATSLVIIAIVDIEQYFIPDLMQIVLFIFVVIFALTQFGFSDIGGNFLAGILYSGFGFFLYILFRYSAGVEAIGFDDIKILFTIGFALGVSKFLPFIFLTGIFGIIFGSLWMKIKEDETFPFAPSLCLAMIICLTLSEKFNIVEFVF